MTTDKRLCLKSRGRSWIDRCFSLTLLAFLGLTASPLVADDKANSAGVDFFEAKIRPVLIEHCYSCHSAEAAKNKKLRGGLHLDSKAGVHSGGDSGPAVALGKPKESLLVKALRGQDGLSMPPKKLLPANVLADFERWIEMGAPDPRDGAEKKAKAKIDIEAGRSHWAFQSFSKPMPPVVKNSAWVRMPIDAFLLAKMEKAGLAPAPEVDRRVWLRRVYLDLIGLPPTPKEQSAFLSDASNQAYERVVDDLLSRPQYGERWARHWLDIARYGETIGYEADTRIPFAWRYRDYVIEAFNNDLPFDQFANEQLAGDELPDFDSRTQIATTFLRLATNDGNGPLTQQNTLDDTLGMAVGAFLGLNIQCARCHDHKFEPLSQADYYGLMAVFGGINPSGSPITIGNQRERAAVAKALEAWKEEYKTVHSRYDSLRAEILSRAEAMRAKVKLELNAKEVETYVAALQSPIDKRTQGQLNQFDEQFEGVTERLKKLANAVEALATAEEKTELAKLGPVCEKFRARKPQLTQANAVAGSGSGPYKVSTSKSGRPQVHVLIRGEPTNFGPPAEMGVPKALGDGPKDLPRDSRRRLWFAQWMTREARPLLARVLVNRVWQYHFGRGFMPNASAFGLSGGTPSHPELLEWLASNFEENGMKLKPLHRQIVLSAAYRLAAKHPRGEADPGNDLLARWEPRRLESEAIRDSLLAVSGRLNLKMGGPSFLPPIDAEELYFSHNPAAKIGWEKADESEASRRSVYVFVKRSLLLPEFRLLGMADPNVVTPKREVMTTAIQALALFNGRLAHEQAGFLAKRIVAEAGKVPDDQVQALFELTLCRPPSVDEQKMLVRYLAEHPRATQQDATGVPIALQSLCLIILNANEFVYIN
jgi:hypothetical protein